MLLRRYLFAFVSLLGLALRPAGAATVINQDLLAFVDGAVDVAEVSGFTPATTSQLASFEEAVRRLLDADVTGAESFANAAGFEVVAIQETETFHGLRPSGSTPHGGGVYLVRDLADVRRLLVLEAPHPVEVGNSARLAARVFRDAGGRAFAMAGSAEDACTWQDGCDDNENSFVTSAADTFFHRFHRLVARETLDTLTLQIAEAELIEDGPTQFGLTDGTGDIRSVLNAQGVAEDDDLYLTNALTARLEALFEEADAFINVAYSCNRTDLYRGYCELTNHLQARFSNGDLPYPHPAFGRFALIGAGTALRNGPTRFNPIGQHTLVEAVEEVIPERCAATEVDEVALGLIAGTPPGNGTLRREHAHVSSALAETLCLDAQAINNGAGEARPQIRVVVDNPSDTPTSTATFTVVSVFTSTDLEVRVWNRPSSGDSDQDGVFKLFPGDYPDRGTSPPDFTGFELTVHKGAPSQTTVTFGSHAEEVHAHFEEPNTGDNFFRERLKLTGDKRVAVLVPHGGDIETHLNTAASVSGAASPLQTLVDTLTSKVAGLQPSTWEGEGEFDDEVFKRFHVTSGALSSEGFPGLGWLLDAAQPEPGAPFRHAVALHGFDEASKYGIVLGGRVPDGYKCLAVKRIRDRLQNAGLSQTNPKQAIAFTIFRNAWANSQVSGNRITLSGWDGSLSNVNDLAGVDADNVANRVSPNPSSLNGQGAWQLEISKKLRNKDSVEARTILKAAMEGLADAIAEVLANETDPDATCSPLP